MNNRVGTTRYGNTKVVIKHKTKPDFIKNQVNPLDFYRHELPNAMLKRSGWNDGGLCPLHSDNKPGSFRVNLITGAYKCFACGAAGGDIIAFVMGLYGLEFLEALTKLAEDWGIY